MPLVFRVSNAGPAAVTLELQGREPTADFVVTDRQGTVVWSKLRGRVMLGSLRLVPLPPGRGLTFRHAWDQRSDRGAPVPPGEYVVRAVLITGDRGGLASPPARVTIGRKDGKTE